MADETPMSDPTPEEIAAGLTEAMREALFHPNGYHDPNTVKALRRRGLWQSALGRTVATLIEKESRRG